MKEEIIYPESIVKRVEAELGQSVKGEIKFDDAYRALYATDSSNYRQVPIGVVFPIDRNDIINTVAACHK
jgi:hypothetical protein